MPGQIEYQEAEEEDTQDCEELLSTEFPIELNNEDDAAYSDLEGYVNFL